MDATELPKFLPKYEFARIEVDCIQITAPKHATDVFILWVSNICDLYYLGTEKTVSSLSPLLQKPSVNPHATLLTLFMCAAGEVQRMRNASAAAQREYERIGAAKLSQYQIMVKLLRTRPVFNAMMHGALYHVRDHESLFEE